MRLLEVSIQISMQQAASAYALSEVTALPAISASARQWPWSAAPSSQPHLRLKTKTPASWIAALQGKGRSREFCGHGGRAPPGMSWTEGASGEAKLHHCAQQRWNEPSAAAQALPRFLSNDLGPPKRRASPRCCSLYRAGWVAPRRCTPQTRVPRGWPTMPEASQRPWSHQV